MAVKDLLFLSLALLLPGNFLTAGEFGALPEPASVTPPAVTAASADPGAAKAEYDEYSNALAYYSNKASGMKQNTPEFHAVTAAGQYLRGVVDSMSGRQPGLIEKKAGAPAVSEKVKAELRKVLGGDGNKESRFASGTIQPGYAEVVIDGGGLPFLAQEDSFLKDGEVILTFDDGPAPGEYSVKLAQFLNTSSAPAVFFVLGSNLGENGRSVIRTEADQGNFVSVHGYFHATEDGSSFLTVSTEKILEQLGGVADDIEAATGSKARFFRPPYGAIGYYDLKAIISNLNLVPLGWTIDSLDWSTKDPDELFTNLTGMISERGKGIILMHDIHSQSRAVAKRLVPWLKRHGYKIVSPERLITAFSGSDDGGTTAGKAAKKTAKAR